MTSRSEKAAITFLHATMAGAALAAVILHGPELGALLRSARCPRCGYRVAHPINRHTPDTGCWSMEGN